jgi:amidohydrolase
MDIRAIEELVTLRRDLHAHPEPRFEERRTSALLGERLRALGFKVRDFLPSTGIVGTLGDSSAEGAHVVLRADMDALPTQDLKDVDYASTHPGVAHACGHDVHCAVVLGAATLLAESGAVPPDGRLTVLYQPAEEIPFGESSGAQAMLDADVFEGAAPDAVLAVHCWPQLSAGTIGLDLRTAMAAKLAFKVSVLGKGAHAATPHLGADALLGASQMVVALHTLLGRDVEPGERVALNIGTMSGGTSQSIVSAKAEFTGTLRTVDDQVGAHLRSSVERVVAGVGATYGLSPSVEWKNEMPAVHNDPRLVDLARRTLPDQADVQDVVVIEQPPMTSDDFALYARRWPGLYMKLGVATPAAAQWPSLHDGRFDVDDRSIPTGAEALAGVAAAVFQHGLPEAADDSWADPAESLTGGAR